MKPRLNSFLRLPSILAATAAFATSAHAADFTWDGGTGNWNATNWNGATAAGPTAAGDAGIINGGQVTINGQTIDSGIAVNSGGTLVTYADPGAGGNVFLNGNLSGSGTLTKTGAWSLILSGNNSGFSGTVNANQSNVFMSSATAGGTGASWVISAGSQVLGGIAGDYTIQMGSLAGTGGILGNNLGSGSGLITFEIGANNANTSFAGSIRDTVWVAGTAAVTKVGTGTLTLTGLSTYTGGTIVNDGTLELSSNSDGYSTIREALTVNANGTVKITGADYAGLGRIGGWNVTTLNVNGGTVNTSIESWLTGATVNLTAGTMNGTGRHQIISSSLNSKASATTSTISSNLIVRKDFGSTNLTIDSEDGAAATDLLISGNIQQVGTTVLTKTGAGTLQLSGTNTYTGATNVNAGTLVLSGAGNYTGAIQVNAGTLSLSNAVIDDAAPVVIANGATVNVNFVGNETVGSLEIDGSGPLPAGTYNSGHGIYGSYFSGAGSLVVAGADGTWESLVDGNWGNAANWASATIATGYDATATFNKTTGVTVTLDSNRIIGRLAFDSSDYIIAGASTLTLDGTVTPTISVGSGRTATISTNLVGTLGMDKTAAGTLVLNGVKTYTGGTTVTAGTLELASTTLDQSAVRGSVTVASGATLKLAGADFTGLGRLGATVTTLEVDGGTVENTVQSWVSGATVNLTGSTMTGAGTYHVISSGFNSIASSTTSTISSNLLIRKDYGSNDLSFDVGNGGAATDLLISGNIAQVLAVGVVKNGEGKLLLTGTNTYIGNTLVNDGALEISSSSGLRFRPTTSGVTNSVSGTSTASLTFDGTVDLDLGAAVAAGGNTWNLFNLGSFSGATPILTPTAVTSNLGSFTEVSTGTWEFPVTNAKWVFTEADGNLAYVVTATDYDTWALANGVVGGANADDDNDGLTNHEEYAFGLDPTGGSSVNAIAVQLNKTTGTFSYQRRDNGLTGLDYTVWYSTDLNVWLQDSAAQQVEGALDGNGVEVINVTLSNAPGNPLPAKLFIQVRAD
jgi:autotransporter-associated beta strand protein